MAGAVATQLPGPEPTPARGEHRPTDRPRTRQPVRPPIERESALRLVEPDPVGMVDAVAMTGGVGGTDAEVGGVGTAKFQPKDFTGELAVVEIGEPPHLPGRLSAAMTRLGLLAMAVLAVLGQVFVLCLVLGAGVGTAMRVGLAVAGLGTLGAIVSQIRVAGTVGRALRCEPVDPGRSEPESWLVGSVEELAAMSGVRPPRIHVFRSDTVDLVAGGATSGRAHQALSTGALRRLHRYEVRGLLAFGVAQAASGDMVTAGLVGGVGNTLVTLPSTAVGIVVQTLLGRGGRTAQRVTELLLQLTVGLGAQIVAGLVSRNRVERTDALAATLVGRDSLVSTLTLIRDDEAASALPRRMGTIAVRPAATEALLEPLVGTHPDVSLRIAALE